jgi:hypothetical protein
MQRCGTRSHHLQFISCVPFFLSWILAGAHASVSHLAVSWHASRGLLTILTPQMKAQSLLMRIHDKTLERSMPCEARMIAKPGGVGGAPATPQDPKPSGVFKPCSSTRANAPRQPADGPDPGSSNMPNPLGGGGAPARKSNHCGIFKPWHTGHTQAWAAHGVAWAARLFQVQS